MIRSGLRTGVTDGGDEAVLRLPAPDCPGVSIQGATLGILRTDKPEPEPEPVEHAPLAGAAPVAVRQYMPKAPNHDRLGAFVLVGADGFEPPTSAL
ncbi:DUF6959 family protein [Streptomyces sp. NPDC054840]